MLEKIIENKKKQIEELEKIAAQWQAINQLLTGENKNAN